MFIKSGPASIITCPEDAPGAGSIIRAESVLLAIVTLPVNPADPLN